MEAWEAFIHRLEKSMGKKVVDHWLRPLRVVDFDACNLYLQAESSFQIAWFEEHVRKRAKEELLNNNAHPIKIHFSEKKGRTKQHIQIAPPFEIEADVLDPTSTLASFITNQKNQFVTTFLRQLEETTDNPIYLSGPAGVGKTHLLMASAHLLQKKGLSVFYAHAETFTQHVVKAIRNSQMQKFREIYRHQDVLLIDDVHHLSRKSATQEELFHTFNTLHSAGKKILLSSHLLPGQLEDVEPRLTSRFEWGIVLTLDPLPLPEMQEVLRLRARQHHFSLSHAVIDYILTTFPYSTKSMMRALEALMLRYRESEPISLEMAQILLEDLRQEEEKSRLSPQKIVDAISVYFGVAPEDILGKSQAKECSIPRKLAMYLCRKKLSLSYLAIGRFFDRDHSTVMANIRQIGEKKEGEELSKPLEEITLHLEKTE